MRTFIAIELPDEIKRQLNELQAQLKTTGADVKWVKPENIHITLKFLGEIDEADSDKIIRILQDIASRQAVFSLRLSSLGAFPSLHSPRVVWAGIENGTDTLCRIAQELEAKAQSAGFAAEERAFSPHITIGRTRSNLNREKLVKKLKELENYFKTKKAEFQVNAFILFKSILTSSGPIYEEIKAVSLTAV